MMLWIENYGEDIDGNRGVKKHRYAIEESDRPQIKEQVQEYLSSLNEDEDQDTELDIVLLDYVTHEEVYFTIKIKDYMCV